MEFASETSLGIVGGPRILDARARWADVSFIYDPRIFPAPLGDCGALCQRDPRAAVLNWARERRFPKRVALRPVLIHTIAVGSGSDHGIG